MQPNDWHKFGVNRKTSNTRAVLQSRVRTDGRNAVRFVASRISLKASNTRKPKQVRTDGRNAVRFVASRLSLKASNTRKPKEVLTDGRNAVRSVASRGSQKASNTRNTKRERGHVLDPRPGRVNDFLLGCYV